MNYKKSLKTNILAAGVTAALSLGANSPVYAANGFQSFGTDGNTNLSVECKSKYNKISDRWLEKGTKYDISNLGNGKNVEECVANNHKSTYGDRVLEDIEGDKFSDGQYMIRTYKYGTDEKTGEFCVNAADNKLAFCDPRTESKLNKQFRNGKRSKVWYDFSDRLGDINVGKVVQSAISEDSEEKLELAKSYILTPGSGDDFSIYPSLYSKTDESSANYNVSSGKGFNGKNYAFNKKSRFPTNIEGMAASIYQRASSVLPEENIVAVTDAAYLQKVTGAKGNLEALVSGSNYFDSNVKLNCKEGENNCISLEDFANGISLSAVHDRTGSDIANYHMNNVANVSSESAYATTLRDGTFVNFILPGDDWILQNMTAYTGRMMKGDLDDKLTNVGETCIAGVNDKKTFSNFNAGETIKCIYGGINSEIDSGYTALGGNKK